MLQHANIIYNVVFCCVNDPDINLEFGSTKNLAVLRTPGWQDWVRLEHNTSTAGTVLFLLFFSIYRITHLPYIPSCYTSNNRTDNSRFEVCCLFCATANHLLAVQWRSSFQWHAFWPGDLHIIFLWPIWTDQCADNSHCWLQHWQRAVYVCCTKYSRCR